MKKKYTIILSMLSFFNALIFLMLPYVAKFIVDEANLIYKDSNASYDKLNKYIIIMIVFGILSFILRIIYNLLYSKFDLKLQKDLRNKLYESLIHKDINIISSYHRGEIEALFVSDIDNICETYINAIPNIVRSISRVILAVILLILIGSAKYFLLPIIVLGLIMALCAKIYSHFMKNKHKDVLIYDSYASSFVIESIDEAKLIQSYNAYNNATAYYKNLNNLAYEKRKSRNRWTYASQAVVAGISTLIYVFMITLGAALIAKNKISYGSLVALLAVLSNIYSPFIAIQPLINKLNKGKASMERIGEIYCDNINIDKEILDDFISIEIESLYYKYDDLDYIIKNLNTTIKKGDTVRISGPSGIGKSTLLSLILGFNKPNKGRIIFNTKKGQYEASYKTIGLIAYVSQENILFSGSIYDNFKMFSNTSDINVINNALKMANILDEVEMMPNGINTILSEKGKGLSMGQIQRIMIAIAIASNKPIILLDEPTSALDKENEEIIINNLKSLNKTLIYITHRDFKISNDSVIKMEEE